MQFLLIGSAVFLLLLILAADHILNRFIHTHKSRRILAGEAVGALAAGAFLSWRLFPGLALPWRAGAGLLMAAPLFITAAYVTVEVWRKIKQREFDGEIRRLRRETEGLAEELDRIRWEARRSLESPPPPPGQKSAAAARRRQAELAAAIDRWQRSGGMAGLRAMKVDHWREELAALSSDELLRYQRALERELKLSGAPGTFRRTHAGTSRAADFDHREQLVIRLGLIELTRLERGGRTPRSNVISFPGTAAGRDDSPPGEGQDAGRDAAAATFGEEAALEARLVSLQDALTMWEGRRDAFLERKITLD